MLFECVGGNTVWSMCPILAYSAYRDSEIQCYVSCLLVLVYLYLQLFLIFNKLAIV